MPSSIKGSLYGFVVGILIWIVTYFLCDRSCGESPVFYLITILLIGLTLVGGVVGGLWHVRILRIIFITIIAFLGVAFLAVYLSEFLG